MENRVLVVELATLRWPASIQIPTRRFRLFVAADATGVSTEEISQFALAGLKSGAIYVCCWGPDCGRFHDIVDETVLDDDLGERRFSGTYATDAIMTTWHESETLDEAVDYFRDFAQPTAGFEENSDFWVVVCVNNSEWAASIRTRLAQENPINP